MQLVLLGQAMIGGMGLLPCLFAILFFSVQIFLLIGSAAARGLGLIQKSQEELKKDFFKSFPIVRRSNLYADNIERFF
jgi:hypothetical protein